MRNVQVIGKQQLQGMFTGWQNELGRCAAIAEMNVLFIGRDRPCQIRQAGIHEDVVMPGMFSLLARRNDIHAGYAEFNLDRAGYDIAMRRLDKKDFGVCGRG